MTVVKKKMSSSLMKGQPARTQARALGQQRLTDSITGSLNVEGYAVKRDTVARAVMNRKK